MVTLYLFHSVCTCVPNMSCTRGGAAHTCMADGYLQKVLEHAMLRALLRLEVLVSSCAIQRVDHARVRLAKREVVDSVAEVQMCIWAKGSDVCTSNENELQTFQVIKYTSEFGIFMHSSMQWQGNSLPPK